MVKWFAPENHSDSAQVILEGFGRGELELWAPDLLFAEVGNIVWKKHTMQGMDLADAKAILDAVLRLPIKIVPCADLMVEAFQLATSLNRTVYDSLYVALSQRESCEFVTADERLVNAVRSQWLSVVWVAAWK